MCSMPATFHAISRASLAFLPASIALPPEPVPVPAGAAGTNRWPANASLIPTPRSLAMIRSGTTSKCAALVS